MMVEAWIMLLIGLRRKYMNQHLDKVIIIAAIILFSIYRRVRRNIGWLHLNSRKIKFRTVIFLIIGLIFLAIGAFKPISLISDIVGILIGIGLAYYSGGTTRFEQRDGNWYYRPNTWIGSLVTLIFLGRLFYRFYKLYLHGNLSDMQNGQSYQNMSNITGSSWTTGLLLIMFAYYVYYNIILLRNLKHPSKSIQL
jgi:hypothetical protein